MFAVFDDVITKEECDVLLSRINSWYFYRKGVSTEVGKFVWYDRILDITPLDLKKKHQTKYDRNSYLNQDVKNLQEEVCYKVINLLQTKLNVILEIDAVELQAWPMNTDGPAHVHSTAGREINDYNSLLYLNNNFDGGEFYTDTGLIVHPKPGRLTFFDGSKIMHGVSEIYNNNRYTMIFWWKNTKFK